MLFCVASACSHHKHASVVDVATAVSDPTFEGNWRTASGSVFAIRQGANGRYTVRPSDSSTTYDADLFDVHNVRFVQFTVHEPTGENDVPIYMFGRLTIKGNDLTFRRIRAEWLERATKGMDGVVYKSTAGVQNNSGGIVAADPSKMHEVLSKAAADPAAFGETEAAHRVK